MTAWLPWIASALTLATVWRLGREESRIDGWVTGLVGNAVWIAYAGETDQLALGALNMVLVVFHYRGLYYAKKERDQ